MYVYVKVFVYVNVETKGQCQVWSSVTFHIIAPVTHSSPTLLCAFLYTATSWGSNESLEGQPSTGRVYNS